MPCAMRDFILKYAPVRLGKHTRYRHGGQPRSLQNFRTYESRAVHEGKTLGLLGVEGGGNAGTLLGGGECGGRTGEEGGNSELHVYLVIMGEIQGNISARRQSPWLLPPPRKQGNTSLLRLREGGSRHSQLGRNPESDSQPEELGEKCLQVHQVASILDDMFD